MKSVLKLELKKAFQNKFFWSAIVLGILITLLSFQFNIERYMGNIHNIFEGKNPMLDSNTVFMYWIGGEPFSLGSSLYFFLFPLLATLPYGWSYCEEKQNGYRRMVISKTGKKKYYAAKYTAVFLSGGVAMVIPLLVNFLMVLYTVPAICPDVMYMIYNAVFGSDFLSGWYYTMPFLYVAVYLCIDFLYCGLLACISMVAGGWIRQKWVTVLVPFLILLFIHISSSFIYTNYPGFRKELSPFFFLRGTAARQSNCGGIILLMGLVLFVVPFVGLIREWKKEVY